MRWIDNIEEFIQAIRYEQRLVPECKVSAQVGEFVGMCPNMDKAYVLRHVSEAEEVWSGEEQKEKQGQGRGENKELREGPSGWRYGEQ